MFSRRFVLSGLIAAPAVISIDHLMPIKMQDIAYAKDYPVSGVDDLMYRITATRNWHNKRIHSFHHYSGCYYDMDAVVAERGCQSFEGVSIDPVTGSRDLRYANAVIYKNDSGHIRRGIIVDGERLV